MLAQQLGIMYFDIGLVFRGITYLYQQGMIGSLTDIYVKIMKQATVKYVWDGGQCFFETDNQDLTERLRTEDVATQTSAMLASGCHMRMMGLIARALVREVQVYVCDGRAVSQFLCPDSPYVFYLTAEECVRVDRRYHELLARGQSISRAEIASLIQARDKADMEREIYPQTISPAAHVIDTSHLTPESVCQKLLDTIKETV